MPGTLFVVATPIGNLEDITLRALRILRDAAVVAAEDTRRTGNLLRHFGVTTRLVSLHEHNEHRRIPALMARLQSGDSVAVVSDAGTPGVSDPGMKLVRAAVEAGVRVEPVPGPSAVLAALAGSGLEWSSFTFLGFPPYRSKDRIAWLERLSGTPGTLVFFEAPHRIRRTLAEATSVLGNRPIVIGRELTKVHEEFIRGTVDEVLATLDTPRGEFTVVVGEATAVDAKPGERLTDDQVAALVGQTTENLGGSRKQAIRRVAVATGLSPNDVYDAVERHKLLVKQQNA